MDVSVIIINYNTFALTCDCIRSVIGHTHCSYEIILVDNASVETNAEEFKEIFPEINLIKSPVNLGFAKGNNLGIAQAKGEYILLLNSDTVLVNDAIDLSLKRMKEDDSIGALSCQLISADGSLQYTSNKETTIAKNLSSAFKLHKLSNKYKHESADLQQEHFTDWVWGAFMMVPKKMLSIFPCSRLHEDFFMYGEDRYWCHTIRQAGYKVLYYPAAKVMHYISASTGLDEERKMKEKILPNEYIYFKLVHNNWYAFAYYFSRSFMYLMFFNRQGFRQSVFYLHFGFSQFFKNI